MPAATTADFLTILRSSNSCDFCNAVIGNCSKYEARRDPAVLNEEFGGVGPLFGAA
jgi:hypothetical protein